MRLDPISTSEHGPSLWNAIQGQDDIWTWLPYGPFGDEATFFDWLNARETARDPWFYAFVKRDSHEALGMGAFMRLDAANGVIEIGNIWMAPALQRTREATEAIYLMMRHCFDDLSVRRLEWKCDALNAPSRRAAARFGFEFEGLFRQHMIIKGRNRDTTWFAMIDKDWPRVRAGFEAWLDEGNFDDEGRQRVGLYVK